MSTNYIVGKLGLMANFGPENTTHKTNQKTQHREQRQNRELTPFSPKLVGTVLKLYFLITYLI